MSLLGRFIPKKQIVSELIGRFTFARFNPPTTTVDKTRTDYKFWDYLLHGRQTGYELSGLFAKPLIEAETAFVLGDGFTVNTNYEDWNVEIQQFIEDNMSLLLKMYRSYVGLGDAYVAVNPDGSLEPLSPATVEIETHPLYGMQVEAIKVISQTPEGGRIEDRYDNAFRTLKLSYKGETVSEIFPNIIGRIPINHWANNRDIDEVYGRPVYDALLWFFKRYHDIMERALTGVEMMAVPKPKLEGVDDAERAKRLNATDTESVKNEAGEYVTQYVMDWNDIEMIITEGNAKFGFASPDAFANEFNIVLKKMFLLLLEHTSIPEWVWGGAVQSSKASVDAQLPAFIRFIAMRRVDLETFLRELIEIWLAYRGFFQFVPDDLDINFAWPPIIEEDENQLLNWVRFGLENGLLSSEEALRISPLPIDDPALEIAKAREEAQDAQDAFNQRLQQDSSNNTSEDEEQTS